MCNVTEDIEELSNFRIDVVKSISKNCKKCGEKAVILLQKKDPFCQKCYYEYCDHKFRSTIGKTKKIKHGDKVLLACSGGRKSSVLMHMTKKALDSASAKQISFIPAILFIDESVVAPEEVREEFNKILKDLLANGYPLMYTSLEMVYQLNNGSQFYHYIDSTNFAKDLLSHTESQNILKQCLAQMQLSAKIDFIKHLRFLLMTEIAHHAGYKYVFVGDTACSLAANLLTDISLGRGSQISADTNFLDDRYKVVICRPLREFLNKELAMYIHFNDCPFTVLPDLLTKTDTQTSIHRLTESFISNLQEDFPATVFTIFRTGGKLLRQCDGLELETCVLCKSKLDNMNPDPCSALEALKLSQRISDEVAAPGTTSAEASTDDTDISDHETKNIFKYLCHGCSIPFRNKPGNVILLPSSTEGLIRMNRDRLRGEIKDYLIEENS